MPTAVRARFHLNAGPPPAARGRCDDTRMHVMIVVTGRVQIPAEHRERFLEVATQMCRSSREDDGCVGYRVYADLEQPEDYVFIEEWRDDAALQEHFTQPHTTSFISELPGLLGGPPDALFHSVSSSRKLDPARGLVPLD
jgi:quinol monooxygenase YgiN